jgi:hypothetical protein
VKIYTIGRKRWSQMRHEWQCSTCEQIFTRKWNCQRHVKDSHAGDGQVVPMSVYPNGGKGRKRNGGKRYRNGYFYDYRSPAYASGAFAGMGNYYGHGSLAAAGPYRKNRQTWVAKWDVRLEQARRIMENMEKVFEGPSSQAVASDAPRQIPTEMIVGTVCEKCGSVSYLPLPHPYTGSYDVVNLCVCNNRDKPAEEEDSQRRLVNIRENISPQTLKRMVDSWLMGHTKYLAAYRLPLERLSALPAFSELKWYEIDAAKIKNNGNAKEEEGERMVNEPRPHTNNYIVRAIRSSDQSPGGSVSDGYASDTTEDVYGWVPLTEVEVFDFLTKARATAMVCHVVYSRDGNGSGGGGDGDGPEENGYWYYLKIVPRHEIVAREQREQNAMINSMIKKMHTEMMSELKKEEEEEEAFYNQAEPRESAKENHSGSDSRGGTCDSSGRQEQAVSGADTGRAAATHKTGTGSAAGTERKTRQ